LLSVISRRRTNKELGGQMSEWISVKDRLPAPYQSVLLAVSTPISDYKPRDIIFGTLQVGTVPHTDVGQYHYWLSRTVGVDLSNIPWSKITHWMPFPEMPQEMK
jgi:hypothetical protein